MRRLLTPSPAPLALPPPQVGDLARSMGFRQVSLSSVVMPMVKMVPRGFTAAADAYLTPHIMRWGGLLGCCAGGAGLLRWWWILLLVVDTAAGLLLGCFCC
jgi:hypothetical protein